MLDILVNQKLIFGLMGGHGLFLSMKVISEDLQKVERVGDHCENLWRQTLHKTDQKATFSEVAYQEIEEIASAARRFLHFVSEALGKRAFYDEFSPRTDEMEDVIDELEDGLRNNYIACLSTGECAVLPSLQFIDMLHNFEKSGDHTYNVAQTVVGRK